MEIKYCFAKLQMYLLMKQRKLKSPCSLGLEFKINNRIVVTIFYIFLQSSYQTNYFSIYFKRVSDNDRWHWWQ